MSKPTDTETPPATETDEDVDAILSAAFGNAAGDEDVWDFESGTTPDEPETTEEPEAEEAEEEEAEEAEEEETEDDSTEEGDDATEEEENDDTDEDDDSEVGDDDGESEPAGEPAPGDGAEETLSDGLLALDMMTDQMLSTFQVKEQTFDPSIVGDEEQYISDAKEEFGDEFDESYAKKMGRMAWKSAVRTARQRWEAGAKDRVAARRDAATASLGRQVNELAVKADAELKRVESKMAVIYQKKVDRYGVDAANEVPVEVYFRLAGGKLRAPKQTAPSTKGVASRKAKAQKQKAIRAAAKPDQIGRVRTTKAKKKGEDAQALDELNAYLNTHKKIEDLFFG